MQFEPPPDGTQTGAESGLKVPCEDELTMAKVSAALSVSAPARVISLGVFNATPTVCGDAVGAAPIGALLMFSVTVPRVESEVPSLTLKVKLSAPVWPAFGV